MLSHSSYSAYTVVCLEENISYSMPVYHFYSLYGPQTEFNNIRSMCPHLLQLWLVGADSGIIYYRSFASCNSLCNALLLKVQKWYSIY